MDNPHFAALGGMTLEVSDALGEATAAIDPSNIVAACAALKARGFNRISAVTAVDWYPREPRFEIVYHLHALPKNGGKHERLRLKCRVGGESPTIASVTSVWDGANWYEREVFDMYGVTFTGHPDLTRILMPDGWEGYPLRKDFPVHGHKYDYAENK